MTTGLVLAVVALALLGMWGVYLTWLGGRHDRLTARADGAWAALDAQLARRAAAARAAGVALGSDGVVTAGDAVLAAAGETAATGGRQDAENALGRAIRTAGWENRHAAADLEELRSAARRVLLARQFHNDAVRDLFAIRGRPTARLLRWARGGTQRYFEIDDTVLTGQPPPPAPADFMGGVP